MTGDRLWRVVEVVLDGNRVPDAFIEQTGDFNNPLPTWLAKGDCVTNPEFMGGLHGFTINLDFAAFDSGVC